MYDDVQICISVTRLQQKLLNVTLLQYGSHT